MVFHIFVGEPLVQGLRLPNDRILQGSHWLVFPLFLFCGELGHPLGAGGVFLGVLQCQVMEVWSKLELLVEMGRIY